jgi:hypothetical protein
MGETAEATAPGFAGGENIVPNTAEVTNRMAHDKAEMSQALTGIVKAGYSPHEQYSSDGRLQGPWSDLYALGGTLYRAIAGRPPEEATLRFDEDHMPSAAKIGRGQFRASFLAAIDACLRVRHSSRPRSVAELRPMLLATPLSSLLA